MGMKPVADQSLSRIANLFAELVVFLFGKYKAETEAAARAKLTVWKTFIVADELVRSTRKEGKGKLFTKLLRHD